MNWLNKHISFKADIILTLLNSLVVIGSIFILNGLIARIHGINILGEFLLIKRTLSAFVGILLVGMNVGLPNYLSRNFEKSYGDNSFLLFIIITIPLTIIFIGSICWLEITGFNADNFWIYMIFSLSISAQFITYALYRGYMNMIGANIFQLLGAAVIPIIIFSFILDIYTALFWIGLSVLIIMLLSFINCNKGISVSAINAHQSKEIIKYGMERMPSFISQFILLAGIPIFLANKVDFESVAYFNSGLSLVRISLIFVGPIGMVLLPRISNKIAGGTKDDVVKLLDVLFTAGIVCSVIITVYCYINAPLILKLWLGQISETGLRILRFAILALPFYAFSSLTRSPIDAVSERGYNSLVYGFGALSMAIIIFIGRALQIDLLTTALFSFLISHIMTGIASSYYIKKLYLLRIWNFKLFCEIVFSIVIMCLVHYLVSQAVASDLSQCMIASFIYLLMGGSIIKFTSTGWLAELKTKIYA